MTVPERYKESKRLEEQRFVEVAEGVDSVTGLPVLIYRFEGAPEEGLAEFDSDNAPRLLWLGSEDSTTSLVVALEPNWRYRGSENNPLQPSELLDLARALRDAAAVPLVHGDIRPERLLLSGGGLKIEGFGVPWRPESGPFTAPEVDGKPTQAGDVYSLAAVVRKIGTAALDDTTDAVLELCAAEDPEERPTAEELYLALERLLPDAVAAAESAPAAEEAGRSVPESGSSRGGSARGGSAVTGSAMKGGAVQGGAAGGGARAGSAASSGLHEASANGNDAITAADPGQAAASTAGPTTGAPAAANTASGDGGDTRRRLALLGVLMAAVILLALLAVYGPRPGAVPALGRDATVYVVEFQVAPEDLPPVTIHLVSSPPGSSLSRGERLGTAPRHLALERGTWVFQGSIQNRRSEPVEVRVPEQRSITLTIPPVPSDTDR